MRTAVCLSQLGTHDVRRDLTLETPLKLPRQPVLAWLLLAFAGAYCSAAALATGFIVAWSDATVLAATVGGLAAVAAAGVAAMNLLSRCVWHRDCEVLICQIRGWLADRSVRIDNFADFHFADCQVVGIAVTPIPNPLIGVARCEVVLRNSQGVTGYLCAEFTGRGMIAMDGTVDKGAVRTALVLMASGNPHEEIPSLIEALNLDAPVGRHSLVTA